MSITQQRIDYIRTQLETWQVDALLLGNPTNRRWVSGFTGSFGWILISAEAAILGTDFRYWEQALREAPNFTLFRWQRSQGEATWRDFLAGVSVVGIEAQHVTLAEFAALRQIEGKTWIELDKTVETAREVKSAEEIAQIQAAAAITDLAMAEVPRLARPGITEKQLAWKLEKIMRQNGADSLAFETIVASGPNGARPHHRPTDRELQIGDNITIDMGAKRDGYYSDMTRSFFLGDEPDAHFWDVYNLVLEAQQNALTNMRADMKGNEVDALARDIIEAAGFADEFGHGLGHGVGLEIHEWPRLGKTETNTLPVNAIVTVEPGIYLPGWGGVRIEDLVVVTESGVDYLSRCPKEPIIPIRHAATGTRVL
ncbi:MAG: aminopeptidase P family protein [Anaerolineae bacterium]|nr:aminopeptidase P family protein [Anaerolineae bacterium]MCO5207884.1 aminopeptidase P family protein [Anaerolineae bacterium]